MTPSFPCSVLLVCPVMFFGPTCFRWKQDAIALIDKLLPDKGQKTVIVGGGVGGWIATLIALERPEKGKKWRWGAHCFVYLSVRRDRGVFSGLP